MRSEHCEELPKPWSEEVDGLKSCAGGHSFVTHLTFIQHN